MINHVVRTVILVLFGLTLFYKTIQSLRAHRLKEKYVLLFLLTSLPFLGFAFWPRSIVILSDAMGIEKPTLMVLGLGAFLILLIFELLSIVSQQDRKIASLAQMVGLLLEKQKMVDREPRSKTADATTNATDELPTPQTPSPQPQASDPQASDPQPPTRNP